MDLISPTGPFHMHYYTNTIFNQLLAFLPKSKFSQFVGQHNGDKWIKSLTTWNQLVALLYAQATGKDSLREIETGLTLHANAWYHLGVKTVARSSLSDANNRRDYRIFEQLFYELLKRCREVTPEKKFSFNNPLYIYTLDARTTIPELITVSDGKTGDITAGKNMEFISTLENGSIAVFDRAYIDYSWWSKINEAKLFFVSRVKKNQFIDFVGQHNPAKRTA